MKINMLIEAGSADTRCLTYTKSRPFKLINLMAYNISQVSSLVPFFLVRLWSYKTNSHLLAPAACSTTTMNNNNLVEIMSWHYSIESFSNFDFPFNSKYHVIPFLNFSSSTFAFADVTLMMKATFYNPLKSHLLSFSSPNRHIRSKIQIKPRTIIEIIPNLKHGLLCGQIPV